MQSDTSNGRIKVWDPLVRTGHWVLVTGLFTAYLTGDEALGVHVWAGYAIAATILIRLVWGLVGTRHARFSDFVRGPGTILNYFKDLRQGRAKHYPGHNPAGGAMIIALLFSLTMTTGTGMALLAIEEGQGPLAGIIQAEPSGTANTAPLISTTEGRGGYDDDDDDEGHEKGEGSAFRSEDLVETLHSAFTYMTLALVALHILGVIVSSLAHKENLVRAMFTGWKKKRG